MSGKQRIRNLRSPWPGGFCNAMLFASWMLISAQAGGAPDDELIVPITDSKPFTGDCASVQLGDVLQFKTDANFNPNTGSSFVEDAEGTVTLNCIDGSVGVIWIAKPEDKQRYSKLQWQWKVDAFPRSEKRSSLEDRDQAAQVIVVYEYDGDSYPARSLVWIRKEPSGRWPLSLKSYASKPICSPGVKVSVEVVRVGTAEGWQTESVDLADAPDSLSSDAKIVGLILFADSNHTRSNCKASIRDVRLAR